MEKKVSGIRVPLVVVKKITETNVRYMGFIPGITKRDIVEKTKADCEEKLKAFAVDKIKDMIKNKSPFPFFPTKKQIYEDYENIATVKFLKIITNEN